MRRPSRADIAVIAGLLFLVLPVALPAGVEIVAAALDPAAWNDIPLGGVRWRFLIRSLWVAAIVAVCSTALAIPVAQLLRHARAGVRALLLAPLWMPAWLIYAGLNLARAPDTLLGDAIMRWALPEHREALVLLGRSLAIGSMVLWCVPVAALALASVIDREADAADELLLAERVPWHARLLARLRMRRSAVCVAMISAALLTIGSAVPLHLAQVDTDTIVLWRTLADRTPDRWGGVWLGSFPQIVVAGLGSFWLVRTFGARPKPGEGAQPVTPRRIARTTTVLAWIVWSAGAVLPVVLMGLSLDSWSSVGRWLAMNRDAIVNSGGVAMIGGALSGLFGIAVAGCFASDRAVTRRLGLVAAGVALFGFLAPGVLMGAAIARLGVRTGLDPLPLSVIASTARTCFLGAIAGLIVARSESPEHRAMRRLDAMGGSVGWIAVDPRRAARLFAGVCLGAFLLGLHEIEASVMVRPPGAGNLPQQMLADLHYARLEQLSAGGVAIGIAAVGFGVVVGLIAGPRPGQPAHHRAVPPTV